MNREQVATLLAKCAAFDNRKPDPTVVVAWCEALDSDMPFSEASRLVGEHYANRRDWIMPADLNTAWRSLKRQRVNDATQRLGDVHPAGLGDEPALEVAWKRAFMDSIGAGVAASEAYRVAYEAVGRPQPAPEVLTRRDMSRLLDAAKHPDSPSGATLAG